MAFWSWRKRLSAQVESKEHFPSLVFLMEKTLDERFGINFVRGAIEEAFGVKITAETPSNPPGEDFLIGEWPMFDFSVGGYHMQILFLPMSYFDERASRIVPGDRRLIRTRATGEDLPAILDQHAGMIKVWMYEESAARCSSTEAAYAPVGKMLAAFAPGEPWAILWPGQNEIRVWEPEMQSTLAGGSPLTVFR